MPKWSLELDWLTDLASFSPAMWPWTSHYLLSEPRFLSTGHGKSLRWHLHQCLAESASELCTGKAGEPAKPDKTTSGVEAEQALPYSRPRPRPRHWHKTFPGLSSPRSPNPSPSQLLASNSTISPCLVKDPTLMSVRPGRVTTHFPAGHTPVTYFHDQPE